MGAAGGACRRARGPRTWPGRPCPGGRCCCTGPGCAPTTCAPAGEGLGVGEGWGVGGGWEGGRGCVALDAAGRYLHPAGVNGVVAEDQQQRQGRRRELKRQRRQRQDVGQLRRQQWLCGPGQDCCVDYVDGERYKAHGANLEPQRTHHTAGEDAGQVVVDAPAAAKLDPVFVTEHRPPVQARVLLVLVAVLDLPSQ